MLKKDKKVTSSAQIKDGALVLYLPTALKPCVWRMDLNTLSETSFEIDEKEKIYILNTRDINGVIKSIAGFENKEDAQEALSHTLHALMSESSTQSTKMPLLKNFPFLKLIKWLGVLVIFLLIAAFFLIPVEEAPQDNVTIEQNTNVIDDTGNIKAGVPIDVDSLFQQTDQ